MWVVPAYISLVEVVRVATPKASGEEHFAPATWSCSKRGKESRTMRLDDEGARKMPALLKERSHHRAPFFPQLTFTNLDMNVAHISPAVRKGGRASGWGVNLWA